MFGDKLGVTQIMVVDPIMKSVVDPIRTQGGRGRPRGGIARLRGPRRPTIRSANFGGHGAKFFRVGYTISAWYDASLLPKTGISLDTKPLREKDSILDPNEGLEVPPCIVPGLAVGTGRARE